MEYRKQLFDGYRSLHVSPREGEPTLATFRAKGRTWSRLLGPFLPSEKTARIIDLGCGDGRVVWWLHSIGFAQAEGVDISPEQVALARALGVPNIRQADLRAVLEANPGAYHAIIMRDVLEHFAKADVLAVLQACRSALREGGRLILQLPNAESPFFGRIRYGDFTHEVAFSAASAAQVLGLAGFGDIAVFPVAPPWHGPRTWPRRLVWSLVERTYKLMLAAEVGPAPVVVTQNLLAVARKLPSRR